MASTMQDVAVPIPGGHVNVWRRPAHGDASTAVLIHGLSGNSRWWSAVIDLLPRHLGIIALDVRGRGLSTEAPPPYDLATLSDDVARSLDHLQVERAVVAGYSMGGWVAALFGVDHADRVERLVLVDGGFPVPIPPGTDADEFIDALVGPSLRRLEIEFDEPETFFDYWKGHPALAPYWDDEMKAGLGHELEEHDGRFVVRADPEAIRVGATELAVGERPNAAGARLRVPTHLIVVERGTLDQAGGMIPLAVAEAAAADNPHLTMEYLEDLNHYTLVLGSGAPAVAAAIEGTS
jgi:pimeloyl-ACP methyl ester carboxylesterase